jgi:hypothetical protein
MIMSFLLFPLLYVFRVALDVDVVMLPLLNRPSIAMRLRLDRQVAANLPIEIPDQEHPEAMVVAEVKRLYWGIWKIVARSASLGHVV